MLASRFRKCEAMHYDELGCYFSCHGIIRDNVHAKPTKKKCHERNVMLSTGQGGNLPDQYITMKAHLSQLT
jgi:hypothetical protein